ncbi:MAG: HAMP domain-containing protein, partial [Gammaproteobacteria bacterium]
MQMQQTNLLKTTAVRLALRYALLYSVLMGVALSALFLVISNYVDSQLEAGLRSEFHNLRNIFNNSGQAELLTTLEQRAQAASPSGRFYILVDKEGKKFVGNLLQWPPETNIPLDSRVHSIWVDDDAIPGGHHDEDAYWPLIAGRLPDGSRLLVAQSVHQAEELQLFSLYVMAAIFGMIVILALAMGITMSRSILRRIDSITVTAGNIMAGKLAERVPISARDDEFDALSLRLNAMLD